MWRSLVADPLTRGWAVVTGAGLARLGLGLVASFLIARALGPAAYGIYAVLAATVGILGAIAEGGLTEAAVLRMTAATQQHARHMRARAFFWLRLGLAAVVIGLLCALAHPLAEYWLHVDAGLLRWALIGIVATALSGATSGMLQALGAFGRMSWLTLFNTGLTAALAAALALSGVLNLLTALIVLGIGTSVATFLLGVVLLPRGWTVRWPGTQALRAEARELIRTGRWLWIASMFAMLAVNLDVLILNRWADLALVGAYALAANLASKADLVNQSLYTVLLSRVALLRDGRAVRDYVRGGFLRSIGIAVGLVLLIPFAEPMVVFVYGEAFRPSAQLLRWLLGVVLFDVFTMPLLLLPLTYRRPWQMAAADALRAATLGAVGATLVPWYGAYGAIAARATARAAGAVLVLSLVWRNARDPGQRTAQRLAVEAERPV
ncbi:MAG: oligosaccharide flippase family protein [Chloroflexi bacterium]|nr:oligosaccharide flippase family protein [Chloroflexota bacterium]MBV9546403.1 oligosaccharide flippase family protein [Chloroflexota bacterium]